MANERISTHPLLMYPITRCIARNLNFRELLLIRQVCVPWKYQADLLLKGRIKVVIRGSTKLRKMVKSINPDEADFATNFMLESVELGDAVSFFLSFGTRITHLTLKFCVWSSIFLNAIIFEQLQNLISLSLITNHNPTLGTETLLPMSLDHCCKKSPILKLRSLELIGDFSHRTDVLYRILRCSPLLESIKQFKYLGQQDGLFGTWFFEILLSCKFRHLKCVELDCSIIEQQCQQFALKVFALERLNLTFDNVKVQTIINLIENFESLKNVEIGVKDNIDEIAKSLLTRFKSKRDLWISVYDKNKHKLVFPIHQYVV